MAGGGAGQMPAGTGTQNTTMNAGSSGGFPTQGTMQQWNSGSNWANPVQGNSWQNPQTAPMGNTGTGSMVGNQNVYQAPKYYGAYGNLNDPANAAGRRQQNIAQATAATQADTQQADAQTPQGTQNMGIGGYGYGPGYGGHSRFGYNPYGGGISGLYGMMGMGGQGDDMMMGGGRGFNPYTIDAKPFPPGLGGQQPEVQIAPPPPGQQANQALNADDAWRQMTTLGNFAPGTDMAKAEQDFKTNWASRQGGAGAGQSAIPATAQGQMNSAIDRANSMPGRPQMPYPNYGQWQRPRFDSTMSDNFGNPGSTGMGFGQTMGSLGGAPTSFGPSYGK